jgi:hypothetical protein
MKLELNTAETELVTLLLVKELEETRVEVHHAKRIEYKEELQTREKLVQRIIERLHQTADI